MTHSFDGRFSRRFHRNLSVIAAAIFVVAVLPAGAVAASTPPSAAAVPSTAAATAGAAASPAATTAPTSPGAFVPLAPQRLLDTRNGTGTARSTVPAGGTITVHLAGAGPTGNHIPTNISAVAINITVTNTTASGYLTAYPDLTTKPSTSTLGFTTNQTIANFAIVPVGTNGNIDIYNGGPGTTDIIGDVAGYYLAGTPTDAGAFAPLAPQRLLDTRNGTGTAKGTVPAGGTITVHLAGAGPTGNHIPTNISAVAINITVTNTTASGYLTAYPDLTTKPSTSTLGFTTNQTIANFAIVPVGTNGNIDIYNGGPGTTDIIGDVAGYYLAGTPTDAGAFAPLAPQRLLDTRNGTGTAKGTVPAGGTITVHLAGAGPTGNHIPTNISAVAVAINITVTNTTASGYLTAYPDLTTKPSTSTLGFTTNQTIANFAIVPVGTNGNIDIYNGGPGTTDIIGDVAGYYLAPPPDTTPPGPVTGLAASSITSTGLTLGWTNPGGDFTGTTIRRAVGTTPPGSPTQGTAIADTTATSFTDSGLTPGTAYSYALFAHDAVPNYATAATVRVTTTTAVPPPSGWSAPTAIDALHGTPASLSCPTAGFCAAVDSMGLAMTYQSGWSKPIGIDTASAQAGGLTSVSCVTATFCVAVDSTGHALTYTGSAWSSPVVARPTARLASVSCVSTSFCVAVGSGGVATTFNGSTWTAQTIDMGQTLAAVSCSGTAFCAAVEAAGRVVTWNGSTWSTPRALDANGSVTSVDCVSTAFCVAVDSVVNSDYSTTGHAVAFTSTSSSAPVTADSAGGLAAVSCTAVGVCRAADDAGGVVTLATGQWTRVTTAAGPFAAVSCATGSSCTAIDAYGSAVQFSGTSWGAAVPVDLPNTLTAVSCSSPSFCAAVDVAGQAVSFSGTAWGAPVVADSTGSLNSVSCSGSSSCTAVGLIDAVTSSGSGWSAPQTIAANSQLTSISCAAATSCVAVGGDGTAVVQKNGYWSTGKLIDAGQSLNSVSCASAAFCVAVDDAGRAFTYNGSVWAGPVTADATANNSLVSVSCRSSSFCMAVDVGGSAVRFNGTSWSTPVSITQAGPTSVSCSSTARCTAVDTAGNAITFDGTKWSAPLSIDPGSAFLGGLTQVSCPTDASCTAIDQAGQAVRGSW